MINEENSNTNNNLNNLGLNSRQEYDKDYYLKKKRKKNLNEDKEKEIEMKLKKIQEKIDSKKRLNSFESTLWKKEQKKEKEYAYNNLTQEQKEKKEKKNDYLKSYRIQKKKEIYKKLNIMIGREKRKKTLQFKEEKFIRAAKLYDKKHISKKLARFKAKCLDIIPFFRKDNFFYPMAKSFKLTVTMSFSLKLLKRDIACILGQIKFLDKERYNQLKKICGRTRMLKILRLAYFKEKKRSRFGYRYFKMTTEIRKLILEDSKLLTNEGGSLNSIHRNILSKEKIHISRSQISAFRKDSGIKKYKCKVTFQLLPEHKENRVNFCKDVLDKFLKGDTILFTDEKPLSIYKRAVGNLFCYLTKEQIIDYKNNTLDMKNIEFGMPKFSSKCMLAGGISCYGITNPIYLFGSVDYQIYLKCLALYYVNLNKIQGCNDHIVLRIQEDNVIIL